ncbi:CPBP family intramembrane metalloprotease [Geomonas nitrogeniifigens]|uniref:CPBP family intramembrane metalloprotease n=1 Tax=Geomonas diazotrophica TaxID=2843197 RepID=A0ABX8JPN7_9BACT|nr:CPBP family intramembrane glutamic endopeptidase [Geomonas nitrogeniifigens]QWV98589.1 CPBP family intramembrane metalloprotease [Geomonas nitrogeniifigens]
MNEHVNLEVDQEEAANNGSLSTISVSIIVYMVILLMGFTLLPIESNAQSFGMVVGLVMATAVLVIRFPRVLSFHRPSVANMTFAIIAGSCLHIIAWSAPINIKSLEDWTSYDPLNKIVFGVFLCLLFPFAEEIYFRGLLFPIASLRLGKLVGATFSIMLFTLYHMTSDNCTPYVLIGGISLWLVNRSGTIIPSILMHITWNSIWLVRAAATSHI